MQYDDKIVLNSMFYSHVGCRLTALHSLQLSTVLPIVLLSSSIPTSQKPTAESLGYYCHYYSITLTMHWFVKCITFHGTCITITVP